MPREIANAELGESDVPPPNSGWQKIGRNALSFNGYEWWGSFEKCAEIGKRGLEAFRATGALPGSLTESCARACSSSRGAGATSGSIPTRKR